MRASRAPKPSQEPRSEPSLSAPPPAAAHLPPCCLAAQNELPGPGSYEQDGKLVDSKIYSKKGLGGGFVSKTVRNTSGKASMTPAPGAYEINRRFTAPVRPGEANSSGFMPPTLRSVTVAEDPLPGPGQYGTPELGVPSDRSPTPTASPSPLSIPDSFSPSLPENPSSVPPYTRQIQPQNP